MTQQPIAQAYDQEDQAEAEDESQDSSDGQAILGQRFVALLLDLAIALALALVAWSLTLWHHKWIMGVVSLVFFVLRDALPGGQSPGKRIMHLKTHDTVSLMPCGVIQSLRRNLTLVIPLFWPVELFLLGMGAEAKRLGDWLANTEVTRVRRPVYMEEITDEALISRAPPVVISPAPEPEPVEDAPPPPPPKPDGGFPKQVPTPEEALGVSEGCPEEVVEQAYWDFVDRYSDDAVENMGADQLRELCLELNERFERFDLTLAGLDLGYDENMTELQMRQFIHGHFIVVNRARDALSQGED